MEPRLPTPRMVLLRDLLLFQVKLIVDGLKDLLLVKLAILVAIIDLVFGGRNRGRLFYGLLRGGEKFDLWLNLYGPTSTADASRDGLLASPASGADGVAARMEAVVVLLFAALRGRIGGRRRPAADPRRAAG